EFLSVRREHPCSDQRVLVRHEHPGPAGFDVNLFNQPHCLRFNDENGVMNVKYNQIAIIWRADYILRKIWNWRGMSLAPVLGLKFKKQDIGQRIISYRIVQLP